MDEEVFLDYHIKKNDTVWLLLGGTGAGMGCIGNLIFGKKVFLESVPVLPVESGRTHLHCNLTSLESFNQRLCLIVPPNYSEETRENASLFITDLTEILLMTRFGIDAFLIVVDANVVKHNIDGLFKYLQRCVDVLGNYWNHSILVVTNGNEFSENEDEHYKIFQRNLEYLNYSGTWPKIVEKVNHRFVIVEPKKKNDNYRKGVLSRLLKMSDDLKTRYHDILQYIVSEAITKAKQQQMKGNATDTFHWVFRLVSSVFQLDSTKHTDEEITELKLECLGYYINRYFRDK